MSDNFSCLSANLSRDSITEEAWMLPPDTAKSGVIAISSILLVFMLVGVPWNIAVLAALIYDKFFKTPSNFLLFNLAAVDLLTGVLAIPFQVVPGLAGGVYNLGSSDYRRCQACHAGVLLIVALLYMSIHLTAVMSVDRLVYIRKPIAYEKWITVPRLAAVVALLYFVCFLLVIPPLFQFGVIEFARPIGTCTPVFDEETKLGKSYFYTFFLVLEAMIPIGVLIVCNIWLLCYVRKNSVSTFHRTYSTSGSKIEEVNLQAKKKYTTQQLRMAKVFGSVFVANFVTWSPATIIIILIIGGVDIPPAVYGLLYLSFLSQSVIHPIVESCLVHKIRSAANKVFCFCCKKKFVQVARSSTYN